MMINLLNTVTYEIRDFETGFPAFAILLAHKSDLPLYTSQPLRIEWEMIWLACYLVFSLWGLNWLWTDSLASPRSGVPDTSQMFIKYHHRFGMNDSSYDVFLLLPVEQQSQQLSTQLLPAGHPRCIHDSSRDHHFLAGSIQFENVKQRGVLHNSRPRTFDQDLLPKYLLSNLLSEIPATIQIATSATAPRYSKLKLPQTQHYTRPEDQENASFSFPLPLRLHHDGITSSQQGTKSPMPYQRKSQPRYGRPESRQGENRLKRKLLLEDGGDGSTKSAKTRTGQSPRPQIRSCPSLKRHVAEAPSPKETDYLNHSGGSDTLDAEGESRILFEILGDASIEKPTLDQNHPFSELQNDLVAHAYGLVANFARDGTEIENIRDFTDSEDVGLIRVEKIRRFLCPFYAHDNQKYRDCLKVGNLRSILDVKRHICSSHPFPFHCAICFQIFANPADRDAHTRQPTCPSREKVELQGVGADQVDLFAQVPKKMSNKRQWRIIFNIALPQKPLPKSIYSRPGLEGLVDRIRSFWDLKGEEIVSGFVMGRIPEMKTDYLLIPDEERSLAALHRAVISDVLKIVIDKFYKETHDISQGNPTIHSG
jgi:hypothetical protein